MQNPKYYLDALFSNIYPSFISPYFFPVPDPLLDLSSGNFLNKSESMSIGAAIKPATLSNGGLLGADGWLLVGMNIFVRPKLFAIASESSWLSLLSK
jgi:hypothetical protein